MRKIGNLFKKHIFREDLDLQTKWWHRLSKVLFTIFVVVIAISAFDTDWSFNTDTKYTKVEPLSERITAEVKTLSALLESSEGFGDSEYSPILNTENDPLYFVLRDTYCSKKLADNIGKIRDERSISTFYFRDINGRGQPVSFDTFSHGIRDEGIHCVMVDAFTNPSGKNYFLESRKDYQDSYSIYKEAPLYTFISSAFNFLATVAAVLLVTVALPIVVVILYGSRLDV